MRKLIGLVSVFALVAASWFLMAEEPGPPANRNEVRKQFDAGNFKVAYDGYRKLALDPKTDPNQVASDLGYAVQALRNLGRVEEFDDLVESSIKAHEKNWHLLRG